MSTSNDSLDRFQLSWENQQVEMNSNEESSVEYESQQNNYMVEAGNIKYTDIQQPETSLNGHRKHVLSSHESDLDVEVLLDAQQKPRRAVSWADGVQVVEDDKDQNGSNNTESSADSEWFVEHPSTEGDDESSSHPIREDDDSVSNQFDEGPRLVLDKENLTKLESELSPAAKDRDNDSVATNYSSQAGGDANEGSNAGTVILSNSSTRILAQRHSNAQQPQSNRISKDVASKITKTSPFDDAINRKRIVEKQEIYDKDAHNVTDLDSFFHNENLRQALIQVNENSPDQNSATSPPAPCSLQDGDSESGTEILSCYNGGDNLAADSVVAFSTAYTSTSSSSFVSIPLSINHKPLNVIDHTQSLKQASGSFFRRTNPSPNKNTAPIQTQLNTNPNSKTITPTRIGTPRSTPASPVSLRLPGTMSRGMFSPASPHITSSSSAPRTSSRDKIRTVSKSQRDMLFQSLSWDAPSSFCASHHQESVVRHRPSPIRHKALFQEKTHMNPDTSTEYNGKGLESKNASHLGFFPYSNNIHKHAPSVLHRPPINHPDANPRVHRRPSKDSSIMEETEYAMIVASPSNMALETSQRVKTTAEIGSGGKDMEREDALDFLTCLVERSKAFEREQIMARQETSSCAMNAMDYNLAQTDRHRVIERTASLPLPDVLRVQEELIRASILLSKAESEIEARHNERYQVIQELVASYSYAMEMKRATTSASMWLDSIGRGQKGLSALALSNTCHGNDKKMINDGENFFQRDQDIEDDEPRFMMDPSEAGSSTMADVHVNNGSTNGHSHDPKPRGMQEVLDRLNATEARLRERDELVKRLNADLAQCRTEIGRLQQEARAEKPFKSPNHSMLDDDSDDSSGEFDDEAASSVMLNGPGFLAHNLNDISEVMVERDTSDEFSDGMDLKTASHLSSSPALSTDRRIGRFISQNTENLHEHLPASEPSSENARPSTKVVDEEILDKSLLDDTRSPSNDELVEDKNTSERCINVKMLDAENFSTEWDELSPLPPPPDHGLRAPIVHSLLDQWTRDSSMQESLLDWMESLLDVSSSAILNVPPLTLSSLDFQVKEGFTMHVLPLLLRRDDIYVKVMTRTHRRTTYDISVSVAPTDQMQIPLEATSHSSPSKNVSLQRRPKTTAMSLMTFNATSGYSAVGSAFNDDGTESEEDAHQSVSQRRQISSRNSSRVPMHRHSRKNHSSGTFNSLPGYDEVFDKENPYTSETGAGSDHLAMGYQNDANSVASSITGATCIRTPPRLKEEKSVFLKALGLGGAFGGFLQINRSSKTQQAHENKESVYYHPDGVNREGHSLHQFSEPMISNEQRLRIAEEVMMTDGMYQPHHRVVSAPPGRIGIELVQFRGHAMVSNVLQDSPLSGWVFASDILIAVDEVPVSGLRVKDIVTLLTSRSDRHRALRVISSHAMDDLISNR